MTTPTDGEFTYAGFRVVDPSESENGLRTPDDTGTVAGTPAADLHEALFRLAVTRGYGGHPADDDEFRRIMTSPEAYQFVDYMLLVVMLNVRYHAHAWRNVAHRGGLARRLAELIVGRTFDDGPALGPDDDDVDVVAYHGATPAAQVVELPEEEDDGEST